MNVSHIGYEIRVEHYKKANKQKLPKKNRVRVNSYYLLIELFFFLRLPFLFVFCDACVTCHVGAYMNPGEDVDT